MKRTSIHTIFGSAICAFTALLAASCSSTEVVDAPDPSPKGKLITIDLSGPATTSTRADASHLLRYTAKLFSGSFENNNVKKEFMEMRQAIASDDKATITFSVEEGTYSILLFADYIPAQSAQANEAGLYEDCYYDTSNKNEVIKVKKFEINNDHLDCFSGYLVVDKTAQEVREEITLSRMVSKIRFVSLTDQAEDFSSIKISRLCYFKQIDQIAGKNSASQYAEPTYSTTYASLAPVDENSHELFFFYTPANTDSQTTLKEISFSINNGSESRDITIPSGELTAKRNTITTVQGAFLSPVPPVLGDIILDLSIPDPDGWESNNITVTVD